jgi:hypothetical protein
MTCSRYARERPATPNTPGWLRWKEFRASLHQWTECGCKMRGDEAQAEIASMVTNLASTAAPGLMATRPSGRSPVNAGPSRTG